MQPDTPVSPPWGTYSPSILKRKWLSILHTLPKSNTFRRIALWLRKPIKNSFGKWVDLEIWGLKLRLRAKGNLSEQRMIFMPQFLDTTERLIIADEFKNGGIFLDIGANAGVYSLWVASLKIPGTQIESFEPDPELCKSLAFNIEINSLGSINLNPIAIGRTEGSVNLISGEGNKGENHIQHESDTSSGITVKMTTLPRFLESRGIQRIDAMKIDIEGFECDALEPLFTQTPNNLWPKLLICEVVHDDKNQLASLLAKSGYKLVAHGRLNGIYRLTS